LPAEVIEDSDKSEWQFQQSAIWADLARGFRGDNAKYNHGTWHYINVPHFLHDADRDALAGKLKVNDSLVPGALAFQNDGIADPAEHFKGKSIEVIATVLVKEERPRIEVEDSKQVRWLSDPYSGTDERSTMCVRGHVPGDICHPSL
jgi:hypothetical protein